MQIIKLAADIFWDSGPNFVSLDKGLDNFNVCTPNLDFLGLNLLQAILALVS